jgi:hypothetical protein
MVDNVEKPDGATRVIEGQHGGFNLSRRRGRLIHESGNADQRNGGRWIVGAKGCVCMPVRQHGDDGARGQEQKSSHCLSAVSDECVRVCLMFDVYVCVLV